MDILAKIKQAGLAWRGGAYFPLFKKLSASAEALAAEKPDQGKGYVVCNAAAGEPGAVKDSYILEHYPEKIIDGIKIAVDFLSAKRIRAAVRGYLYVNPASYKKLNGKLITLIKDLPIQIFIKPANAGYIGGETSAVLNGIEGKRIEPRLKPPPLTAKGLWGRPTFTSGAETFYNISLVAAGGYARKRFYAITGDCFRPGVYELPDNLTVEELLRETKNYPLFSFFVQNGGFASGENLNSSQLNRPAAAGQITVYRLAKNNFKEIVKGWLDFFVNESCGQCAPCREGTYRLNQIFSKKKIDWAVFNGLLDNLRDTALCAFGGSMPIPLKSFMENVHPQIYKSTTNIQIYKYKT